MTEVNKEEMFDLSELGTTEEADQPIEMEIAHPKTGAGTGLLIMLVGRDSEAYRALQRKLQNKRFDELKRTRKLNMTAEQSEEENLRLLGACVKGWRSRIMERVDGVLVPTEQYKSTFRIKDEELECNIKNVERVFRTVPEIREQVEDFIQDRTNFLKGSQTTSSSSPV